MAVFILSEKQTNCEILLPIKRSVFCFNMFIKCNLFLWCKAESSASLLKVYSVTWSNMWICCSRNIITVGNSWAA